MEGNMAPPGAYESHEAREAQPTSADTTRSVGSEEGAAPAAAIRADGTDMRAPESDDAAQRLQGQASATDASMDQEEKRDDNDENMGVGDSMVVLNLKFLHRDRVSLSCAPTILIADLKQLVRNAYIQAVRQDGDAGTQDSQQREEQPETQPLRLIYKGKVMKDDQTLASYNFLSEDTVHAIFSRPVVAPATGTSSGETSNSTDSNGSTRSTSASAERGQGGNVFMFETDASADRLPDFTRIISSIVNSAMSGHGDTETTATIHVFPGVPHGGGASESTGSTSTSSTSTGTAASATVPVAAQAQRGASVLPASASGSVVAPNPHVPAASSAPATLRPGNTMLLNQAASLRRSIPALELAPLSRPPELSEDMYTLGNAMRESGDTYLAIHRQLQFLATRFQQDNYLSVSERARLRSRVQQLVPVMENVSQLSSTVAQQLANSPYGELSRAVPPSAQTNVPPQVGGSGAQTPTQAATSSTPQPPFAQAVQTIFTELLGAAGVGQPPPRAIPGDQGLNVLPTFLSNLVALTTPPQANTPHPQNGAQQATTPAMSPQPPATTETGPTQMTPFRSFAPKLLELLSANPALANASLNDFLRAALPAIDRHIVMCYHSAGPEAFAQNGVAEVENALRLYEQAHQRVYVTQESRRSIIRLAMQELTQICLPMAASLDARSTDVQSWIRRSCSHFFAELCEIAPAATAAEMVGLVVMQLLSGNDQSFVIDRSAFLNRVAVETCNMLRRRFQFS